MSVVGLLTIGQSPRPDLTEPLRRQRPDLTYVELGALDHLTDADLAAAQRPQTLGAYPLTTRLRSGVPITLDRLLLEPLLQRAVRQLEAHGVIATVLLCAGTFDGLTGTLPLLRPFDVVQGLLHAGGLARIGVVCPYAEQEQPIRQRWQEAGFVVQAGTASLADLAAVEALIAGWTADVQAIVLDYVGHEPAAVKRLQARCARPLFDLGESTMNVLAAIMPRSGADGLA